MTRVTCLGVVSEWLTAIGLVSLGVASHAAWRWLATVGWVLLAGASVAQLVRRTKPRRGRAWSWFGFAASTVGAVVSAIVASTR